MANEMIILCKHLDIQVWHILNQKMWDQLKTIDHLDLNIAMVLQNLPVKWSHSFNKLPLSITLLFQLTTHGPPPFPSILPAHKWPSVIGTTGPYLSLQTDVLCTGTLICLSLPDNGPFGLTLPQPVVTHTLGIGVLFFDCGKHKQRTFLLVMFVGLDSFISAAKSKCLVQEMKLQFSNIFTINLYHFGNCETCHELTHHQWVFVLQCALLHLYSNHLAQQSKELPMANWTFHWKSKLNI